MKILIGGFSAENKVRSYMGLCKNSNIVKFIYRFRKWRSKWRRLRRLTFVSPAEIAFIRLMGGHVLNIESIRNWSGCQLVIFCDLGKTLKSHGMQHELKVGRYFVDFGNGHKALEVDGSRWHMRVVDDAIRDEYLKARGVSVMHIKANELKSPFRVRAKVIEFLSR